MKPAMRPLRLLPLTAVLAFGLVGKITLLGDRVLSEFPVHLAIPVANASGPAQANTDKPANAGKGEDGQSGGESDHGSDAADQGEGGHGGGGNPKRGAYACPPPPPPPEPTGPTFSETELQVLQQLSQRRDKLSERENDLQRREALLSATEQRIDEKVASLKQLQTTLDGLIRQHDAEQETKLTSLVKIYETMKPADAARIFEQLDSDTLLPVVEKMNERKLAAILAKLDPMKARDVTVELKKLRELAPQPPT